MLQRLTSQGIQAPMGEERPGSRCASPRVKSWCGEQSVVVLRGWLESGPDSESRELETGAQTAQCDAFVLFLKRLGRGHSLTCCMG